MRLLRAVCLALALLLGLAHGAYAQTSTPTPTPTATPTPTPTPRAAPGFNRIDQPEGGVRCYFYSVGDDTLMSCTTVP